MTELIHRKKRTKKINLKESAKKLAKGAIKYSPGTMGLKMLSTAGKQFVKNIKNKKQTTANKKAVQQRLKKGGSVRKMSRGGRVKK